MSQHKNWKLLCMNLDSNSVCDVFVWLYLYLFYSSVRITVNWNLLLADLVLSVFWKSSLVKIMKLPGISLCWNINDWILQVFSTSSWDISIMNTRKFLHWVSSVVKTLRKSTHNLKMYSSFCSDFCRLLCRGNCQTFTYYHVFIILSDAMFLHHSCKLLYCHTNFDIKSFKKNTVELSNMQKNHLTSRIIVWI